MTRHSRRDFGHDARVGSCLYLLLLSVPRLAWTLADQRLRSTSVSLCQAAGLLTVMCLQSYQRGSQYLAETWSANGRASLANGLHRVAWIIHGFMGDLLSLPLSFVSNDDHVSKKLLLGG